MYVLKTWNKLLTTVKQLAIANIISNIVSKLIKLFTFK